MNEEEKKNLIEKCQLTYDEDEQAYLTDILTPVSDTLQDVVILYNIEGTVALCFTTCEMANTLVGKMTATARTQLWDNGCYTDLLDRVPGTGQLINAEILYDLIVRRRFDTIGFIKYKRVITDVIHNISDDYHYVFPIPRSVAMDASRPLSTGDSPTFYLNGQRLDEFKHQSGFKTLKKCIIGRNVESVELTLVYNDVYVQTDALNALLSKRYNQFNLVWCSRVEIFGSNSQVNMYLACPTNGDTLSQAPQEEFEDCQYLQKDELNERYRNAVNEANEAFARELGIGAPIQQPRVDEQGFQRLLELHRRQMQWRERERQEEQWRERQQIIQRIQEVDDERRELNHRLSLLSQQLAAHPEQRQEVQEQFLQLRQEIRENERQHEELTRALQLLRENWEH